MSRALAWARGGIFMTPTLVTLDPGPSFELKDTIS